MRDNHVEAVVSYVRKNIQQLRPIMISSSFLVAMVATFAMASANSIEEADVSSSGHRPAKAMVQAFMKHGKGSPITKLANSTYEEAEALLEKLLAWKPPKYIEKNFPYYFVGYSYDGNPVWIAECGKFDTNKLVDRGPEMIDAAELAFEQWMMRIIKKMTDVQVGDEYPKAQLILDMDGLDIRKLSSPRALALLFKMALRGKDPGVDNMENAIVINVNYFAQTVINALRPVMGQFLEKVETFGSNKETWMPRIHRILPSKSLPEWYGGDKDFKPVAIYG